jgi:hydroxymethylglutaryl-CoA synthase
MGSTYSSSTFIGLLTMLESGEDLNAGDRISMFSYGAGSCAEFYSVKACAGAHQCAQASSLAQRLDARRALTVPEYEELEQRRTDLIDLGDYETVDDSLGGWYERHYKDRGYLVFRGLQDYYRQYEWS